jgi:hypothetical protein
VKGSQVFSCNLSADFIGCSTLRERDHLVFGTNLMHKLFGLLTKISFGLNLLSNYLQSIFRRGQAPINSSSDNNGESTSYP